jgi:ribosomal protein S6
MSNLLQKSSRFQEDCEKYESVIATMPEGNVKNETVQLLQKLTYSIKKLDSMHLEMIYARQLPTMGNEMKEEILGLRKKLETRIRDWSQAQKN